MNKRRRFSPDEDLENAIKFLESARAPGSRVAAAERTRQLRNIWAIVHRREFLQRRKLVCAHMAAFVDHARTRNFASRAAFIGILIGEFYVALEVHCTLYERESDESVCDEACCDDHAIVELCADERVFGCVRHSSVHECAGEDCAVTRLTRERSHVCLFSGIKVGVQMSGVASVNDAFKDGREAGSAAIRASEYEASGVDSVTKRVGEAAAIVARIKASASLGDPPTAEATARQAYKLRSYISRIASDSSKRLVEIAGRVIDDLLFDGNARDVINSMLLSEAEDSAHNALLAYHVACRAAGVPPNAISEAEAFAGPLAEFEVLTPIAPDQERRTRFVRLACRLWELCHRSPRMKQLRKLAGRKNAQTTHSMRQSTCDYAQFCTALLYMHRVGLRYPRQSGTFAAMIGAPIVFVPCIRQLDAQLAEESLIYMFGRKAVESINAHVFREPTSVSSEHGQGRDAYKKAPTLFKRDGTRRVRNQRNKKRSTMLASGASKIVAASSAGGSGTQVSVRVRDALPPHLHRERLNMPESYESTDVTRGQNFITESLMSLPVSDREKEARALFDL